MELWSILICKSINAIKDPFISETDRTPALLLMLVFWISDSILIDASAQCPDLDLPGPVYDIPL